MATTMHRQEGSVSMERIPLPVDLRQSGAVRGRGDATRFSVALAAAAAVTAAIGAFFPSVFRDTAMTAGNARGTDLVILIVAIPALLAGMLLARRHVLWGPIVWLGALAYITYNAVFFAYAVHFNRLFLLDALTLGLAVWSVVTCLGEIEPEPIRARLAVPVCRPHRRPSGFAYWLCLLSKERRTVPPFRSASI